MRLPSVSTADLKVFLPGAGLALAAGLLLGGAMQPHLSDDDRPAGPQIIADSSGERSTGSDTSATILAAYHGQMPDYVLGTDWKKSQAWPAEPAPVSQAREVRDDPTPDEAPATLTRVAYAEPPAPAAVRAYPSLGGGVAPSVHAATDTDVAADDDSAPDRQD